VKVTATSGVDEGSLLQSHMIFITHGWVGPTVNSKTLSVSSSAPLLRSIILGARQVLGPLQVFAHVAVTRGKPV
jgi:hypothetical protein